MSGINRRNLVVGAGAVAMAVPSWYFPYLPLPGGGYRAVPGTYKAS